MLVYLGSAQVFYGQLSRQLQSIVASLRLFGSLIWSHNNVSRDVSNSRDAALRGCWIQAALTLTLTRNNDGNHSVLLRWRTRVFAIVIVSPASIFDWHDRDDEADMLHAFPVSRDNAHRRKNQTFVRLVISSA